MPQTVQYAVQPCFATQRELGEAPGPRGLLRARFYAPLHVLIVVVLRGTE